MLNTNLYALLFEHDYEEEALDLFASTFVLMKDLHQSFETIMKLPREERIEYVKLSEKINKSE